MSVVQVKAHLISSLQHFPWVIKLKYSTNGQLSSGETQPET